MELRPYQREAVEAAMAHMRRSLMPACMELATGAGKSHILAAIAKQLPKKTLVLQSSIELLTQNHEKFVATGEPASIFSASAGSKSIRYRVVYATPQSVKNSLARFKKDEFSAVLIDEADMTTPTIKSIIDDLQTTNPKLRVLGVTGTPYRMNHGYIYQYDVDGSFVEQSRNPYFNKLIYRIGTRELIEMGFLTPVHADPKHTRGYDSAGLKLNAQGKFDSKEVERVFQGRGRLTSEIVADIVRHSQGRRGVMIFAATVQHAKEVMESLDPNNSMMLAGDINAKPKQRSEVTRDFKAQKYKYIVSVQMLTVGVDAPHVDVVAIMRATESARLFQQIVGRGLRLNEGKDDCMLLDYAGNIDRHELHDDLFKPRIEVKGKDTKGDKIPVVCPDCGFENQLTARENKGGYGYSEDGYFLDLDSNKIETDQGPMPSHYGRRCTGQVQVSRGYFDRCAYRWTGKECPECGSDNDIAARYCWSCKAEIVDPHERLSLEFCRVKKDPYAASTDKILEWSAHSSISQSGKETLVANITTDYRSFKVWFTPESKHPDAKRAWRVLCEAVFDGRVAPDVETFIKYLPQGKRPKTVTYARRRETQFFEIYAFNQTEDKLPDEIPIMAPSVRQSELQGSLPG